jgi:hypothetical protein
MFALLMFCSELDSIDSYSLPSEFPVCVACLRRKSVMLPERQVYPLHYEMDLPILHTVPLYLSQLVAGSHAQSISD